MNKRYIALPRDYLSYSQYCLWTSNPKRYAERYFDGRPDDYSNTGQQFGKLFADALENGARLDDLLTGLAADCIKKYDVADQQIDAEFKEKGGRWLKVIAKPDTYNSITHEFREYKTGKTQNPWDERKAQNHIQMIWYAVVIWLSTGTMNKNAYLDWIETEDTSEGIKPASGLPKSFEVTFKPSDYYEFQAKMLKVAHEIEEAWAAHITKPYLTTF